MNLHSKFENVCCNLCKSTDSTKVYSPPIYEGRAITEVRPNLVMCNSCNFVYSNPQLTDQALIDHYLEFSSGDVFKSYAKHHRAGKLMTSRVDMLKRSVPLDSISNMCDIGGGSGALLKELARSANAQQYLVEPSNAGKANQEDYILINKTIEEVTTKDVPKFDLILCVSVLEHLKRPLEILQQLYNLLDDDGYLFIEVPDSFKSNVQISEFYSFEHLNHFTYYTFINLLIKNNFHPINIDVDSLRVVAQKVSDTHYKKKIVNHFENYSTEKNKFESAISNRLDKFINSPKSLRFSIYGAGEHSLFLLSKFNLLNKVDYFIDSDKRKWGKEFCNKKVIGPDEIVINNIETIIISSGHFEMEIFETINLIAPNVKIITLYAEY